VYDLALLEVATVKVFSKKRVNNCEETQYPLCFTLQEYYQNLGTNLTYYYKLTSKLQVKWISDRGIVQKSVDFSMSEIDFMSLSILSPDKYWTEVERLDVNVNFDISMFIPFLVNLRSISLRRNSTSVKLLQLLEKQCPRLEKISFQNEYDYDDYLVHVVSDALVDFLSTSSLASKVESISCRASRVDSLSNFSNLSDLLLDCYDDDVPDIDWFLKFPVITRVNFSGNGFRDGHFPIMASSWPCLTSLEIFHNNTITDSGLLALSRSGLRLKVASIYGCSHISSDGLLPLVTSALEEIEMNFDSEERFVSLLAAIGQTCPDLNKLAICNNINRITDSSLTAVSMVASHLKSLRIESDLITDEGIRSLTSGRLKSVRDLRIEGPRLSAASLPIIFRAFGRRLEKLDLRYCDPPQRFLSSDLTETAFRKLRLENGNSKTANCCYRETSSGR
jgi:hypothetical protein